MAVIEDYKVYVDAQQEPVVKAIHATLDDLRSKMPTEDSADVAVLYTQTEHMKTLVRLVSEAKTYIAVDCADAFLKQGDAMLKQYNKTIESVKKAADTTLQAQQKQRAQKVEIAKAKADGSIDHLIALSDQLQAKSNEIQILCTKYNIDYAKIDFPDNLTKRELEVLLKEAIRIIDEEVASLPTGDTSSAGKGKLLQVFDPDTIEGEDIHLWYTLAALALWMFGGGIIGSIFLFKFIQTTATVIKKSPDLELALSVTHQLDLEKYKDSVEEVADVDEETIRKNMEEELALVTEKADLDLPQRLQDSFNQNVTAVNIRTEALQDELDAKKEALLEEVKELSSKIQAAYKAAVEAAKTFGKKLCLQETMEETFVTGFVREVEPITEGNLSHNRIINELWDDVEIERTVRMLLVNALSSVSPNNLKITLLDKRFLGAVIDSFRGEDFLTTIELLAVGDTMTILREVTDRIVRNKRKLKSKTIREYNLEAEELGKVCIPYTITIIYSREFSAIGAREGQELPNIKHLTDSWMAGEIIWVVGHDQVFTDAVFHKDPFVKFNLTTEFLDEFASMYIREKENVKPKGILVEEAYHRLFTKEAMFSGSTDKFIDVHFGLIDGDPSLDSALTLGEEGCVHALTVGATGAGKSAMINQLLITMLWQYSPRVLEMIMVDLKAVEFGFYTGDNLVPHASIIAGTTDGAYCLSVFEHCYDIMLDRQKSIQKAGCKNLSGYNKKMRSENKEELIFPRTLILVDEFQVMFGDSIPLKMRAAIADRLKDIAKLGRALGVHIWLTSQSMTGTLNKDVLDQFMLRSALRCQPTVSDAILGSRVSGEITQAFGLINTNTNSGDGRPENTVLWKVPFAPEPYLRDRIRDMQERCKAEGIKMGGAKFYDEVEYFGIEAMLERQKKLPPGTNNVIILGEPTFFHPQGGSVSLTFKQDNMQNLFCVMGRELDYLQITYNLLLNVKNLEGAQILIHSKDDAIAEKLNYKDYVDEQYHFLINSDFLLSDLIPLLSQLIDYRKTHPEDAKEKLFIFMSNYEKCEGLSVAPDYRLADKFKLVIMSAGKVNIHFIFLLREIKDLPTVLKDASSYKLLGLCDMSTVMKVTGGTSQAPKFGDKLYAELTTAESQKVFKLYQDPKLSNLIDKEIVI